VARFLETECADVGDVVPMPGALALLARLRALRVPGAIVTSAERPLAALRLAAAGVAADTVATIDDVAACKPPPGPGPGHDRDRSSAGLPVNRSGSRAR
jgi:mannitol-1-/sugar-/sorbitol-6-phosphatase